jgi:hypothetical protein
MNKQLDIAINNNDLKEINKIIKNKYSLSMLNIEDALVSAARSGNEELVNKIILLGARDFNNGARGCIENGHDYLMEYLLELLKNGNVQVDKKLLCLESVKQKRIDLIQKFYENKFKLDLLSLCNELNYEDVKEFIVKKFD